MYFLHTATILSTWLATCVLAVQVSNCHPFPSSVIEFSSGFKQPEPPLIKPNYETSFIQHKWNQNLSHITTGYIQNSPTKNFVRVDEAYNGTLVSSFFNYANVSKDGLVDNTLTTYGTGKSSVWRDYVNSNFPLFPENLLIENEAVFGGLVHRQFNVDLVASWSMMYQAAIPVTVYVNNCNVVVGYDYFSSGLRTRVVTEYFNIQA